MPINNYSKIYKAFFELDICDTFEEEKPVDIPALRKKIAGLESELVDVRKEMDGYLKELNL